MDGWNEAMYSILCATVPSHRSALTQTRLLLTPVRMCACGKFCFLFISSVCWILWRVTRALTSVLISFECWPAAPSLSGLTNEEIRALKSYSYLANLSLINVCCHHHSAGIPGHVFMLNWLGTCYFLLFSNVFVFNLCYVGFCGHWLGCVSFLVISYLFLCPQSQGWLCDEVWELDRHPCD